mmetsp:Transcript_152773/g.292592  ORF Transcript_152773/g.292592 Transcript_152773/m.292592 type:complete len:603 (+) Transcript_152773:84-1892(+)
MSEDKRPSLYQDIKADGFFSGVSHWAKDKFSHHDAPPAETKEAAPLSPAEAVVEQAAPASERAVPMPAQDVSSDDRPLQPPDTVEEAAQPVYEKPSLREDIKQDGLIGGTMDWVKDHLPGHKNKPPAAYEKALEEQQAETGRAEETTISVEALKKDLPEMPTLVTEEKPVEVTYEKPSLKEDIKHDGLISGTMDWVKDHMPGHKDKPPAMLEHPAKEERAIEPTYEKPSLKDDIRHDGVIGGTMDWVKDHLPGHQHQPPAMYQHEVKEEKPVEPTYEKPSLKEDIKADGVFGGAVDWVKDHLPGHRHQPPAMFQHSHSATGVRELTPTGGRSIGGSVRSGWEFTVPGLPAYATPSRAYQPHVAPGSVRAFAWGAASPSNVNLLSAGRLVGERRVSKDELMSKGNLVEEQGIARTYVAQWDSVKRCFEPPPQVSSQQFQMPFTQATAAFQRPVTPVRTVTPVGQRFLTPSVLPAPPAVVADPMMSTTKTILPPSLMQPSTPTLSAMPPPPVTVEPLFAAHPLLRPISLSRPVTPLGTTPVGSVPVPGPARTPMRAVSPFPSMSAAAPTGLPAAPPPASVRFPFAAVPRVSVARPPSRPFSRRD